MTVEVLSSEGCRSFGDALRDLDSKGLIRGDFILMNVDTITNAQLLPLIEVHKKNCKADKGTAMTVAYKKIAPGRRTGDEVMIATDAKTNRLLFHQRLKTHHKERHFEFPVEIFLTNKEVVLHHDLMDPQIAVCSTSVMSLFSDNFDFETRDHFIKGLLINEEILASTIYVAELPSEQYAAKVSNWNTYQMISKDVINRWAYPLVPDMGICSLEQIFRFSGNNIYKNKSAILSRTSVLKSDVVLHENCKIGDKTVLENLVAGKSCDIGKNCQLTNAFLFENVQVGDNCTLDHCVIGNFVKIGEDCVIKDGAVIGDNSEIPTKSVIERAFVQDCPAVDEFGDSNAEKLGEKAYKLPEPGEEDLEYGSDDEDIEKDVASPFIRLAPLERNYESSCYSSSSEEDEPMSASPVPDDTNIFLSEVLESMKRGFDEKSNPEFLILEINASRFAYNVTLSEVNFYVTKAMISLPYIAENSNILTAFSQVYTHMGSILKNYITGNEAMLDCLNAIAEVCNETDVFRSKIAQFIHFLYDKDILSEDAILMWHENLDEESAWIKSALTKLINWLEQSSEEESD